MCTNPKTPDKSGFKLHTMAKNGVQDSVHSVQGSVHERRNAQIDIACQAHAAPLLYVRPHPTAARRAATLASSEHEMRKGARISLRPLQRRFKARKKPEGYTSTQAGLKRLKTQITASRGNENGKGTPSGVPQPIHKRKLILVKEESDASSFVRRLQFGYFYICYSKISMYYKERPSLLIVLFFRHIRSRILQ